jgi:hypothetical protein
MAELDTAASTSTLLIRMTQNLLDSIANKDFERYQVRRSLCVRARAKSVRGRVPPSRVVEPNHPIDTP